MICDIDAKVLLISVCKPQHGITVVMCEVLSSIESDSDVVAGFVILLSVPVSEYNWLRNCDDVTFDLTAVVRINFSPSLNWMSAVVLHIFILTDRYAVWKFNRAFDICRVFVDIQQNDDDDDDDDSYASQFIPWVNLRHGLRVALKGTTIYGLQWLTWASKKQKKIMNKY